MGDSKGYESGVRSILIRGDEMCQLPLQEDLGKNQRCFFTLPSINMEPMEPDVPGGPSLDHFPFKGTGRPAVY